MKKVAVMNDLSGFGKCSLTVAIPVLSALGVQCCPLPSAVLTGQSEYEYYHCKDLTDMIPLYTDAWQKNNVSFDAIYSGYMMGLTQIKHFFDFLKVFHEEKTFLLVDPVMGDDGMKYDVFSQELLDGMKELTRHAQMITPNLTEACLLSDRDISFVCEKQSADYLLKTAEEIAFKLKERAQGEQEVVITGIKCYGEQTPYMYNLATTFNGIFTTQTQLFDRSFSGTGDLFASIMCGCRVNGMNTENAMKLAERFLHHCIEDTMKEDISTNDGVNFEKFFGELIQGISR